MKRLLTPRKALALLAMGLGAQVHPMSVGPLHGATVVGRPLDVSAQVQFDSRDADEKCLRAEVFYGDVPVPAERVHVSVHRSETTGNTLVRVVSPQRVDEPFVTIVMQAGCQASSYTRRYVMLAEPPADNEPVRLASAPATLGMVRAAPVAAPTAAPAPPRSVVRVADAPQRAALPRAAKGAGDRPRLKLESAVFLEPERQPWLRVSTEMHSTPAADPAQRAAAALLWQAINAQPQDILRMNEHMRALERELGTLRELSLKHRHELTLLRQRAQQPAPAVPWGWVGALLALVAATAGFLGYRTSQARANAAASRWYEPRGPETSEHQLDVDAASRPAVQPARPAQRSVPAPAVDVPLDLARPVTLPPRADAGPLEFELARAPAAASAQAAPHGLRVAALAGVLQECEFLVSLDYIDKAADVLRDYIERTREAPALAILEWRELCRRGGDAEGVTLAEQAFRERFGAEPPRDDTSAGLEACESATARITALWPEQRVLELIEDLLFSPPAVLGGAPSLHAWRDLLWLHDLAEDTLNGAAEADRVATSADGLPEMTLERLAEIDFQPAPEGFAVDVNLGEAPRGRNRVIDQQHVPKLSPLPEVPPEPLAPQPAANKGEPHAYEDFFDAVRTAEGRALHLR